MSTPDNTVSMLDKLFGDSAEPNASPPNTPLNTPSNTSNNLLLTTSTLEKLIENKNTTRENNNNEQYAYHVVIDSVCNLDLKSIKPYTHGHLRSFNKEHGLIPVTFSLDDAKVISKKIVTEIDNRGSSSTNAYPIFGTIILKIKLASHPELANVYSGGGKRDYNLLKTHINNGSQIISYLANGVTRAMLNPSAFAEAKLEELYYDIVFDNVDEHVGFAILNSLKLKHHDLYQMKKAYKAGLHNESCQYEAHLNMRQKYMPQKQPVSGGYVDYEKLYMNEKAGYLRMKELYKKNLK